MAEYTALCTIELSDGIVRRGDYVSAERLAANGQTDENVSQLVADGALAEGAVSLDGAETVETASVSEADEEAGE